MPIFYASPYRPISLFSQLKQSHIDFYNRLRQAVEVTRQTLQRSADSYAPIRQFADSLNRETPLSKRIVNFWLMRSFLCVAEPDRADVINIIFLLKQQEEGQLVNMMSYFVNHQEMPLLIDMLNRVPPFIINHHFANRLNETRKKYAYYVFEATYKEFECQPGGITKDLDFARIRNELMATYHFD